LTAPMETEGHAAQPCGLCPCVILSWLSWPSRARPLGALARRGRRGLLGYCGPRKLRDVRMIYRLVFGGGKRNRAMDTIRFHGEGCLRVKLIWQHPFHEERPAWWQQEERGESSAGDNTKKAGTKTADQRRDYDCGGERHKGNAHNVRIDDYSQR